jgi:hypothetical protein
VAAAVVLAFLALANAELTWTAERISFKTSLFGAASEKSEFATRGEVLRLLKVALADAEGRMNETNYLMMQRMLETVEAERRYDLMSMRRGSELNRAKN